MKTALAPYVPETELTQTARQQRSLSAGSGDFESNVLDSCSVDSKPSVSSRASHHSTASLRESSPSIRVSSIEVSGNIHKLAENLRICFNNAYRFSADPSTVKGLLKNLTSEELKELHRVYNKKYHSEPQINSVFNRSYNAIASINPFKETPLQLNLYQVETAQDTDDPEAATRDSILQQHLDQAYDDPIKADLMLYLLPEARDDQTYDIKPEYLIAREIEKALKKVSIGNENLEHACRLLEPRSEGELVKIKAAFESLFETESLPETIATVPGTQFKTDGLSKFLASEINSHWLDRNSISQEVLGWSEQEDSQKDYWRRRMVLLLEGITQEAPCSEASENESQEAQLPLTDRGFEYAHVLVDQLKNGNVLDIDDVLWLMKRNVTDYTNHQYDGASNSNVSTEEQKQITDGDCQEIYDRITEMSIAPMMDTWKNGYTRSLASGTNESPEGLEEIDLESGQARDYWNLTNPNFELAFKLYFSVLFEDSWFVGTSVNPKPVIELFRELKDENQANEKLDAVNDAYQKMFDTSENLYQVLVDHLDSSYWQKLKNGWSSGLQQMNWGLKKVVPLVGKAFGRSAVYSALLQKYNGANLLREIEAIHNKELSLRFQDKGVLSSMRSVLGQSQANLEASASSEVQAPHIHTFDPLLAGDTTLLIHLMARSKVKDILNLFLSLNFEERENLEQAFNQLLAKDVRAEEVFEYVEKATDDTYFQQLIASVFPANMQNFLWLLTLDDPLNLENKLNFDDNIEKLTSDIKGTFLTTALINLFPELKLALNDKENWDETFEALSENTNKSGDTFENENEDFLIQKADKLLLALLSKMALRSGTKQECTFYSNKYLTMIGAIGGTALFGVGPAKQIGTSLAKLDILKAILAAANTYWRTGPLAVGGSIGAVVMTQGKPRTSDYLGRFPGAFFKSGGQVIKLVISTAQMLVINRLSALLKASAESCKKQINRESGNPNLFFKDVAESTGEKGIHQYF